MTQNKKCILEQVDKTLWITLNRPEKHNALDHEMVAALIYAVNEAENNDDCYLIVLQAKGKSFCSGHDLTWMQQAGEKDLQQNIEEANHLADFFDKLYHCQKPIITVVQGPAFGGGVCLLACSDYVLTTRDAHFGFPEVRLGLMPAVIAPFIAAAIGARQAQRYFITGETFSVEAAKRMGLVHDIINPLEIHHRTRAITEQLMKNGPKAMCAAKALIQQINAVPVKKYRDTTTRAIAELRTTKEAKEGIAAFLQRRPPSWISEKQDER